MGIETIIYFILGLLLSVIGFFLKSLYSRLTDLEKNVKEYQKTSDLIGANLVNFKESIDAQHKAQERLFEIKIDNLNKAIDHLARVLEKLENRIEKFD